MSGKTGSASGSASTTATATKKKPSVSISTNATTKAGSASSPSSAAKRLPGSAKPQPNGVESGTAVNGNTRPSRRGPRVSTRLSTSDIPAVERRPAWTAEPPVIDEKWILKTYKDQPPSLIVHLHPTYFRFDQQQGNFPYQSSMKVFIEHLRSGTIPYVMLEELRIADVKFYRNWLIVKIIDHRSMAMQNTQVAKDDEKPGSINNYNHFITPSPYAPYPSKEQSTKMERSSSTDKENQAPEASASTKPTPRVFLKALRPTAMSLHTDMTLEFIALDNKSKKPAKPATPASTVPPTPSTERPPPLKKQKLRIDPKDHLEFEARIINATAPPLYLEPAESIEHAEAIRAMLTDSASNQAPPSPKSRKRTHAELAADESHAKEQERFMTIMDPNSSATGAANVGLDQANNFQPHFEQWNALGKIKGEMDERKRLEAEKRVQEDELRRSQQQQLQEEDNRRKAQQAAIERRKEQAIMQSQANQAKAQQDQMEAQRQRAANAAVQQVQQNAHSVQRRPNPGQPQPNGIPPNMQNQMVAPQGSPIIRQGTPNMASSPAAPVARSMARSGSQTAAASPPRPGSSLQHAHPNAPMMRQPSAQGGPSRNGTPQVPHSTPGMPNATPVLRSGTPAQLMAQQSPMVNMATPQMVQGQMTGQMVNGIQPQQQMTQQQMAMLQQRRFQAMQAQAMGNQMNPQMTNPQMMQQFNLQQQQQMRQQAAQQAAQQQGQGTPQPQHMSPNGGPVNQQAYNAQLRNIMAQQMRNGQGSPQPQTQMSPQQQQQMQQQVNMQQAAMMQGQQMGQQGQGGRDANSAQIVNSNALVIFKQLMVAESQKYGQNPNMIPPAVKAQLQVEAQKRSVNQWQRTARARQLQMQMNGMANGNMNGQPQMTPQQMQQMQQMQQQMNNTGGMNNMNNRMAMMQQGNNAQMQHQQQMQQQQLQMQNAEAMMRQQQQGQQVPQDYMRLLQQQQMQNQNRQG